LEHGGSFPTLKEARLRRDLVAGELAAGRDPRNAIRVAVPGPVLTLGAWREKFLASRIDVDEATIKTYRAGLLRADERFGERSPESITADEVAEWVGDMASVLSPASVRLYLGAFRLLLDYVGRDPNPARDVRVKLPKRARQEAEPPSAEHFLAILSTVPITGYFYWCWTREACGSARRSALPRATLTPPGHAFGFARPPRSAIAPGGYRCRSG
jgi:hypothetical protein